MTPPRAIVISGASRGLGAALARRFAAPGTRLLLTARSATGLEAVAASCRAQGAAVATLACDITEAAPVAAALAAFEAAGPVDLVIANAGTSAGTAPDGTPEDTAAAARQVAVNLIGAMHLVGPLLPGMRARRAGRIGLIASVAALRGLPDFPAYCASKAGLAAWGEGLRAALAPQGVRVTVVLPGFFDSAMGARFHGRRLFVLGQDAVAERVQRALLAGAPRAAFPWPLAVGLRLLALAPPGLGDWAVRRMRFRVSPEA
ncbi:SDR family NAD(P)-dependent oxidoreductase [Falsiroseomonas selenitidurans]|uniref:SDR family NAD(P)-dependent oxidoreductase n=1 Tax=Falsiroseomonas selenitidurans TaxID=2716335 RepID=A0ABX1ECH3_9PROT|nr:SDR family NAD(P)-dependent oxidoreductase [Falsiroseomonas selenitidurans]NKC34515.1 SDR family NAD(P)-dependent oxidoreductase [Falsiroseomonas selenitidurans]